MKDFSSGKIDCRPAKVTLENPTRTFKYIDRPANVEYELVMDYYVTGYWVSRSS